MDRFCSFLDKSSLYEEIFFNSGGPNGHLFLGHGPTRGSCFVMTGQFPQLNFSKIETNFDQTLNTAKIRGREREREREIEG